MKCTFNRACFASDNCAPVHPDIMNALIQANHGYSPSYGDDRWTRELTPVFEKLFGRECYPFAIFNGTGANASVLAHIMRGYTAVVCTDISHINTDETAAPERIAGAKLLAAPSRDGKLTPEHLERYIPMRGVMHMTQPSAICITQATEYGTVYSPAEIRALSAICHKNNMLVYMDGARLANAAAYLDVKLSEFTCDAGIDIVCFGGTKNGLMFGECVVFFNMELAESFMYTRKSTGQLSSKQRYISAQFLALVENDLWLKNARHANECAVYFAEQLQRLESFKLAFPVQANEVFFSLDEKLAEKLKEKYDFFFHDGYWRLVTSFDTDKKDIDSFVEYALTGSCSQAN